MHFELNSVRWMTISLVLPIFIFQLLQCLWLEIYVHVPCKFLKTVAREKCVCVCVCNSLLSEAESSICNARVVIGHMGVKDESCVGQGDS